MMGGTSVIAEGIEELFHIWGWGGFLLSILFIFTIKKSSIKHIQVRKFLSFIVYLMMLLSIVLILAGYRVI